MPAGDRVAAVVRARGLGGGCIYVFVFLYVLCLVWFVCSFSSFSAGANTCGPNGRSRDR